MCTPANVTIEPNIYTYILHNFILVLQCAGVTSAGAEVTFSRRILPQSHAVYIYNLGCHILQACICCGSNC